MASFLGGFPSSIRSARFWAFPQVNIGSTDDSIEIVAFAPGVDPQNLDVSIYNGLLTICGELQTAYPGATRDDARSYAQERFVGAFRRVIELPQHADLDKVTAQYTNGCLTVSIAKREASKPRAITVQ